MNKLYIFIACLILSLSWVYSIKQAITVSALDIRSDEARIAELESQITEIGSVYLNIIFEGKKPEHFVTIYDASYIKPESVYASR